LWRTKFNCLTKWFEFLSKILFLYKKYFFSEKFTFESRRHNDYPFALTLYVNGIIDCRISVCCEYKHKLGIPLGGKRASFAICNVQGGQPCQT
jgi:hypothetical protein